MVLLSYGQTLHGHDSVSIEPSDFNQFKQVDHSLALAGTPNKQGLQALAENSFKLIIDTRLSTEGTQDTQNHAYQLGISYINIPISGANIDIEDVKKVSQLLEDDKNKPVLLMCASGNRATALWMLANIYQGMPIEEAKQKASQYLIRPEMLETLLEQHPLIQNN